MPQHKTCDISPSSVDLRDTFAAAALTGLLAAPTDKDRSWDYWSRLSYEVADAMLRERSRSVKNDAETVPEATKCTERETDHDAVPEAKADGQGRDNPATPDHVGTGNTPSEAEIDALEFVVEEGRIASMDDYGILRSLLVRVRPEWEAASKPEDRK